MPISSADRTPVPVLDALFTATAEYMARRKKNIEFFPGKNAPLPIEEIEEDALTAEETEAEHTWIAEGAQSTESDTKETQE